MLNAISPYITGSNQLITVKAQNWEGPVAKMQLLERKSNNDEWKLVDSFEVVVGKNGLAWGQSLMPVPEGITSFKKEGDMKTPAGLFGFCFAFGYSPLQDVKINWPYLPLNNNFIGVDDPESRYYNCIVDGTKLQYHDWKSAEKMWREDGLYKWGLVIDYNFENQVKGAGSQIFMHIWRGPGVGTEGCIAMPEEKMSGVLKWIDGGKNPLFWVG
jgi:L,D-peptidoglycan transpeptidase YkuD (ErfK/YbiS/YcfS/YnhG family)